MKRILMISAVIAGLSCGTVSAQIYRVAQMNAAQIRALDKQKTVVILTGGILEQHGPHLPSYTDGYSNEWLAQQLAESIITRPGMSVLMFPTIPLGHGGANEIAGKYVYPGSYTVRRTTLRAVFMDLATELGEQGFRWIFIMHGHGSPYHNLMLDQACDFFRDEYGGRMIHLRGLQPKPEQWAKLNVSPLDLNLSESETKENGMLDLHGGLEETSRLMFTRPNLVNPVYRTLEPFPVNNFAELFQMSRATNWLGYFGSPRLANASYGAQLQQNRSIRDRAIAFAILDRQLDERDIPRLADLRSIPPLAKVMEGSTSYEAEVERKEREWMKKKGIE